MVKSAALTGVMIPVNARAREMAGLNRAPETRKKIQTLTSKDRPNVVAMKVRFGVLMKGSPFDVFEDASGRFAMWAAPKAMKRNIVVPIYSPNYTVNEARKDQGVCTTATNSNLSDAVSTNALAMVEISQFVLCRDLGRKG